jgi:hypothetical protein
MYSSTNIIWVTKLKRINWWLYVARIGERRGAYMDLVGRPEGRRPLEICRLRWKDNIKLYLQIVGWGSMD